MSTNDLINRGLTELRALGTELEKAVQTASDEAKEGWRKLQPHIQKAEEVAAATRVIAGLEPRPARDFGGDEPVYITPDIYVHKVGDDFHVLLNEDGLPKLKIRDRCTIQDRFLVVRGDVRTYKIHLGSSNILMEPSDTYLCIVAAQGSKQAEKVFLPFDGDQRTERT